ncbi:MAG: hypothetical protein PHS41_05920 [Victivallaceae bacterium]|nr:hypothetical protein [Victivallaceae bacterium]
MIHVAPHEALRLPMIYLAAFDATKEPRFLAAYEKFVADGLRRTAEMRREYNWWNLELVQMQISLRLCFDLDPDEGRKQTCLRLMRQVADFSLERFPEQENWILGSSQSFSQVSRRWAKNLQTFRPETLRENSSVLYEGKLYLKCLEPDEFMIPFCMVRAIGNLAVAIALCPDRELPAGFLVRFDRCMDKCDWTTHTSGGCVNYLHGAYLLRSRIFSVTNDSVPPDTLSAIPKAGHGRKQSHDTGRHSPRK